MNYSFSYKTLTLTTLLGSLLLLSSQPAQAVCPVCTIAVAGGVGISRWLGIDDLITGIWIGGLLLSMSFWTMNWLNSKWRIKKWLGFLLGVGLMYGLGIIPLYSFHLLESAETPLWGLDRFLLGSIVGTVGFFWGWALDQLFRRTNAGKVYFPYQRVVLPVGMLILLSISMYIFVL